MKSSSLRLAIALIAIMAVTVACSLPFVISPVQPEEKIVYVEVNSSWILIFCSRGITSSGTLPPATAKACFLKERSARTARAFPVHGNPPKAPPEVSLLHSMLQFLHFPEIWAVVYLSAVAAAELPNPHPA